MFALIFSGIIFVIWALFIISVYYSTHYSSVDHINVDYIQPLISSTSGFFESPFGKYFTTIVILYAIYKGITLILMERKNQVQFSILSITGFFLLHLLIVCGVYASMPEGNQMALKIGTSSGISLFFHVVGLLIYPTILVLVARATGWNLIQKIIPTWNDRDIRVRILTDLAVGFFVFSLLLLLLGSVGLFTLGGLIGAVVLMGLLGWTSWGELYKEFRSMKISTDNHQSGKGAVELIAPKLLSIELTFIILTLMMSVAMISIIRPMPIGWDDLGVYMNYPKMLALTGELLPGVGMYSWQLITGSGFLLGYNASQAFFVNQLGSILAIIAIVLGLSFLFEQKGKKSLIALPFILATVYYVMPMTVFHHTKDMKLDPALLFVSISAFMLFFSEVRNFTKEIHKQTYHILIIVGILVGFAFSIKVTTLMLLLALFGLLAYRLLSFWGYMGFFLIFLSIFTGLNLWSIMNVWMPSDHALLRNIALIFGALGLLSFGISSITRRVNLKQFFILSLVLLGGFFLGLSPWILKNTTEVQAWNKTNIDTKTLLLQSMLSGSGSGFNPDMRKIMTEEEYSEKTKIIQSSNISDDGQSKNEDFGRYFGYEEGINNYVRLPINLTFQKNQGGEFTAITYIFLALIPTLFLFARGRFGWTYQALIIGILSITFLYAFTTHQDGTNGKSPSTIDSMLHDTYNQIIQNTGGLIPSDITNILIKTPILEGISKITIGDTITNTLSLKNIEKNSLLYGYLILLLMNIGFVAIIHFLTRNEDEDTNFRETVIVLSTYGFLFLVSAFGIVWYGIFVYFIFFVLIGLLSRNFTDYTEEEKKDENTFAVKVTLTALLSIFIGLYFVRTALPHAWTNLKSAGFNEYKYGILDQESTLFTYRADYLVPIATMNLKDTSILIGSIQKVKSAMVKEILTDASKDKTLFIEVISQLIPQLQLSKDSQLRNDGKILADYVYNTILYPKKEEANTDGIYRIGTFMTYLINKNLYRYYDDSLIFGFDGYFYEPSPEKTIEKMKNLGFKFLLIDLNAATIDRDPRRALTQRYEHLLLTMRAKNLKLVDTDNLCLEFALDEYKAGKLQTDEEFIDIAGTNYESYRKNQSGEVLPIGRGQKQRQCYNAMLKSISEEKGGEKYEYLGVIEEAIQKNNAQNNPEMIGRILSSYAGQSFFALYEITDTPVESNAPTITPTQSGVTAQ